jgi:CMP-N,N'-diacetyllegionaminic acid synthase
VIEKKILGVIPARGGSKGIPRKNLYKINGKPLIQYSIDEAKRSKHLTHVILSTDDAEIAEVGKKLGAEVPFLRPASLATDTALSVDVTIHALKAMEEKLNIIFDAIMLLQPTTPLRRAEDIDGAIEKLFSDTKIDSIVSLVDVGANHPARMYTVEKQGIVNVMPEPVKMMPRQQLPKVYIRSGDIYLIKRDALLKGHSLMGNQVAEWVMSKERAFNIDTMEDLFLLERYVSLHR